MAKKSASEGKGGKPPPQCKAILLCDQVIVDSGTGKVTIVSIFEGIEMPQFPGQTPPFTAFLQLTDGIGRYQVTMEVHDLRQSQVLARADVVVLTFEKRDHKINLLIPVPPLPLNHVGRYDFVVLADSQEIDRQPFFAHEEGEEYEQAPSDEPDNQ